MTHDTEDTPLTDDEQLVKDRSYAPSSGRETEQKQHDQSVPDDVDADAVTTLPGTGGPDDVGDVEVDPADIHLPRRTEAR